ncbi:GTPase [Desulfurobacterium atlanticum]|uniref:50S ribosome-binding GTPase n=1 Tax=Desulfurobacterium atlanticum TaxID=240169 RepID=A0A238XWJ7_9BACT|nr:GTPase [Desulfurobacterium atlanticum]SNR63060.1 50S ribosome-binding GTPase [Desulfurobacterium atlanticum]
MTAREFIENSIQEFEKILEDFEERSGVILKRVASKTKRTKRKYIDKEDKIYKKIEKRIKDFYHNLSLLGKEMEFDTLNVAFFGETNVGKSTLIEALTKGDGSTIGDGRKDFTKTFRAKNFGRKIFLLDMPGIEGNEAIVSEEIKRAAKKSHIIFIVIPENKEPEEGFLEKVRTYIGDSTFVFGIINLRGIFPLNVLEKKKKNIEIVKKRTEQKLKGEFGKAFKEIFIVHGLYAFFAMNSGIPESQKSSYERVMKFVKNDREKLKEFSGINKVIETIGTYKTFSNNVILWSNIYKLFKKEKELIISVREERTQLKKTIEDFLKEIEKLKRKFDSQSESLLSDINSEVFFRLDELRDELEELICNAIDAGRDKDDLNSEIEEKIDLCIEEMEENIEYYLDDFIEDVNKDIEKLIKKLKLKFKRINLGTDIGIDVDFTEAFNSLSLSFKEAALGALSILESIVSILTGPIGAVIAGIFGLLNTFLSWLFGGNSKKNEAKRKAINEVNKTIRNIRNKLRRKVNGELKKLRREINKVEREILKIEKQIENKVEYWDILISLLVEHYISLSTNFFKTITQSVEFAYVAPDSGKNKEPVAIIVGGDIEKIGYFCNNIGIKVYFKDSIESALKTLKSKDKKLYSEIRSLVEKECF